MKKTNTWSDIQLRRLKELEANRQELELQFESTAERYKAFQALETKLIKKARYLLKQFREQHLRPRLCRLKSVLVETLTFVKETVKVAEIPVHANVGMGVGGVPMMEAPPVDMVTRVSKALAQIGKLDGL